MLRTAPCGRTGRCASAQSPPVPSSGLVRARQCASIRCPTGCIIPRCTSESGEMVSIRRRRMRRRSWAPRTPSAADQALATRPRLSPANLQKATGSFTKPESAEAKRALAAGASYLALEPCFGLGWRRLVCMCGQGRPTRVGLKGRNGVLQSFSHVPPRGASDKTGRRNTAFGTFGAMCDRRTGLKLEYHILEVLT